MFIRNDAIRSLNFNRFFVTGDVFRPFAFWDNKFIGKLHIQKRLFRLHETIVFHVGRVCTTRAKKDIFKLCFWITIFNTKAAGGKTGQLFPL